MTITIPIDWRDAAGNLALGAAKFAQPYIDIEISNHKLERWTKVTALVDTGLASTSVHQNIVSELGCPKASSVRLFGSAGWQDFPTYEATFRFPSFPKIAGSIIISSIPSPLGNSGAMGAIGMDLLHVGRLVLDRRDGASYFELP